jgi:hypothetical protein
MSPLTAWVNFYIIVGSSAGALTGLTFVAVTLIAETRQRASGQGIAAFTTPTAVEFGTVLLISAVLSAPWSSFVPPAVLLGLCGLIGMLYAVVVMRRQRRFDDYTPVLEDWLRYAALPLVANTALLVAAILLPGNPEAALFVIGGVMVLLLFLGISNAWDIVTYIAVEQMGHSNEEIERKDNARKDAER